MVWNLSLGFWQQEGFSVTVICLCEYMSVCHPKSLSTHSSCYSLSLISVLIHCKRTSVILFSSHLQENCKNPGMYARRRTSFNVISTFRDIYLRKFWLLFIFVLHLILKTIPIVLICLLSLVSDIISRIFHPLHWDKDSDGKVVLWCNYFKFVLTGTKGSSDWFGLE